MSGARPRRRRIAALGAVAILAAACVAEEDASDGDAEPEPIVVEVADGTCDFLDEAPEDEEGSPVTTEQSYKGKNWGGFRFY